MKDVMPKPLIVVNPEASLEEAVFLMFERRVKKLLVVKDKKLVGLVTMADIARIARVRGMQRLEHADLQASLISYVHKVKVGEDISLEIELVNTGKGPALLIKVEEIIPQGFKLVKKPRDYRVEDRNST